MVPELENIGLLKTCPELLREKFRAVMLLTSC